MKTQREIEAANCDGLHHDISTVTVEAFFVLTVAEPPC
jgi:hypothetical protein